MSTFFLTLVRCIESNQKRIIEGELRCAELSAYLEKIGAPKCVWISEDGTRIVPKVNYDGVTDQIIGLVLPFDEKTGCPKTLSYKATTEAEIKSHMKKKKASIAYVVMAQPLDETFPPFVLQLFGSDNEFTARNVLDRWYFMKKELGKYGITVAGYSSDADNRLLSAMGQKILDPTCEKGFVQDSVHNGTKLRNRLNKEGLEMPMGNEKVSAQHLKILIKRAPKEVHGITLSDVSPIDRQNFSSFEKISSPRVLMALEKYVPESRATRITSSFMEYDLTPIERIQRIWRAAYFFRI